MKTNYDHLIEGGIDALIGKNFSGADCWCCVCLVGEDCVYSGEECARAIKQWLESEYVEPDSWEKLEADADKPTACRYWGYNNKSCADCTHDNLCNRDRLLDIVDRAKKLAGVE